MCPGSGTAATPVSRAGHGRLPATGHVNYLPVRGLKEKREKKWAGLDTIGCRRGTFGRARGLTTTTCKKPHAFDREIIPRQTEPGGEGEGGETHNRAKRHRRDAEKEEGTGGEKNDDESLLWFTRKRPFPPHRMVLDPSLYCTFAFRLTIILHVYWGSRVYTRVGIRKVVCRGHWEGGAVSLKESPPSGHRTISASRTYVVVYGGCGSAGTLRNEGPMVTGGRDRATFDGIWNRATGGGGARQAWIIRDWAAHYIVGSR